MYLISIPNPNDIAANMIAPPTPHELLPPLLACLPIAFASTRPPPALLPLLSPILRQRVQLFSDSASSPSDSWLTKLSWDSVRAEQLTSIVEGDAFELHPISNEIEFDDVQIVGYRRLDEETLHSRIDVKDLTLTVIYLWCVGDATGGGDGWRVAEILPFDTREEQTSWRKTVEEANQVCQQKRALGIAETVTSDGKPSNIGNGIHPDINEDVDNDNDDGYWAQYDNVPASTPGPPQPQPPHSTSRSQTHARSTSEADYFSRYADIQPEMDNDDPSTDRNTVGESTLNGNIITSGSRLNLSPPPQISRPHPYPNIDMKPETDIKHSAHIYSPTATEHPRPPSDTDSCFATVDRLEGSASVQSQTELAVRQHIASSMKSLYRLARSTGMGMGEFEGTVGRELEVLGIEEGMEGG